jgi:hypothetical protein
LRYARQVTPCRLDLMISDSPPHASILDPSILGRDQEFVVRKVVAPVPVSRPCLRNQDRVLRWPRSVVMRRGMHLLRLGCRGPCAAVIGTGAHVDREVGSVAPLYCHAPMLPWLPAPRPTWTALAAHGDQVDLTARRSTGARLARGSRGDLAHVATWDCGRWRSFTQVVWSRTWDARSAHLTDVSCAVAQ